MGTLQKPAGLLSRAWTWLRERQVVRSCSRRLHVAATASLGEKRFVALVQMDGLEFLVGGGASNVVLLAQLNGKEEQFKDVLEERIADRQEVKPAPAEKQSAPSTMRPKVESFIHATANKIVRPAIEHFVRPIAKKPVSQAVAPAAVEPTVPAPARRLRRPPVSKPAAKPVAKANVQTKDAPKQASRPAAKTVAKPMAQSTAKPRTKKSVELPAAKPASTRPIRRAPGTSVKRTGK